MESRSWNEKEKKFYYFEDGIYYNNIDPNAKFYFTLKKFNWYNSEMSSGLMLDDGNKIYSGDYLEIATIGKTCIDVNVVLVKFELGSFYCIETVNNKEVKTLLFDYRYKKCKLAYGGNIHQGYRKIRGINE